MMSAAVTGPIPSIVSSCSAVAVPSEIGPSSLAVEPAIAAVRSSGPALGDHHLLAVREPGGAVDGAQQRRAKRPARPADGVDHPGPGRQPVDARAGDRPGDVDDHVAGALGS